MTTTLADTFTDGNGTLLADHDPDVGGAGSWEAMGFDLGTSAPTVDLQISANTLVTSDDAFGARGPFHRNNTDPGADEYDIEVTWTFQESPQATRDLALGWRMSPTGTASGDVDRYVLRGNNTSSPTELSIFKVVSGSSTSLASAEVELAGTHDVRVEARSDGATVFFDGQEVLSTSDTEITQRGRAAVCVSRGDEDQFMDDLSVDSLVDIPQPIVDVGPDRTVDTGSVVTVEAIASVSEGTIDQYQWEVVSGVNVSLNNATTDTVQFTAPAAPGSTTLRCTVTTDQGQTADDDIGISFLNVGQYARPEIDFHDIDVVKSNPSASTYAELIDGGSTPTLSTYISMETGSEYAAQLTPLAPTSSNDGWLLDVWMRRRDTSTALIDVELRQDGVVIATRTFDDEDLQPDTFQLFQIELSSGEAESIPDRTQPLELWLVDVVTDSGAEGS